VKSLLEHLSGNNPFRIPALISFLHFPTSRRCCLFPLRAEIWEQVLKVYLRISTQHRVSHHRLQNIFGTSRGSEDSSHWLGLLLCWLESCKLEFWNILTNKLMEKVLGIFLMSALSEEGEQWKRDKPDFSVNKRGLGLVMCNFLTHIYVNFCHCFGLQNLFYVSTKHLSYSLCIESKSIFTQVFTEHFKIM
jgi:hypothetical protein